MRVLPFLGYSLLAVTVVPPLVLELLVLEDLELRRVVRDDRLRDRRRRVRTISFSRTTSGRRKSSSPNRCGSATWMSSYSLSTYRLGGGRAL